MPESPYATISKSHDHHIPQSPYPAIAISHHHHIPNHHIPQSPYPMIAISHDRHIPQSPYPTNCSIPSHFNLVHATSYFLRTILLSSSNARLLLPGGSFTSYSPPNRSMISSTRSTCAAHLTLLDLSTLTLYYEEYIMQLSATSHHFLSLFKIEPYLPQLMFCGSCDKPSFKPISNDRQNYSSVNFNPHIFSWQTRRTKTKTPQVIALAACIQVPNMNRHEIKMHNG